MPLSVEAWPFITTVLAVLLNGWEMWNTMRVNGRKLAVSHPTFDEKEVELAKYDEGSIRQ